MSSIKNIELFQECDAIVCDLDGTLYHDSVPIPKSHEFLDAVMKSDKKLYYFTNNTSKSRKTYLDKLESIDFPSSDELLFTSGDCADIYLKREGLFPEIYLVGNRDLTADYESRGYNCFTNEQVLNGEIPKAVLLGFDTEIDYEKINTAYQLIIKDIPYIATHADKLCPVLGGNFKPDVGSFISMFETATGGKTPIVVGKPHEEAVKAISEKSSTPPEKIAFIGDRLYTDIRMADQNNMVGVLVLSGETDEAMLKASSDRPKIVVNSVADLIEYL